MRPRTRRSPPTKERPHGLSYSFTLLGPDSERLVGFDNAHAVDAPGSRYKKRAVEGKEGEVMKHVKIQSHADLRKEMKAVASGKTSAPKGAGGISFESVEALMRLLTPENRALLAAIRDKKPQSIAELAELVGRAPPNVTRTLSKLEAIGFVRMRSVKHRKVPMAAIGPFRISVDPFSDNDRLEMA